MSCILEYITVNFLPLYQGDKIDNKLPISFCISHNSYSLVVSLYISHTTSISVCGTSVNISFRCWEYHTRNRWGI